MNETKGNQMSNETLTKEEKKYFENNPLFVMASLSTGKLVEETGVEWSMKLFKKELEKAQDHFWQLTLELCDKKSDRAKLVKKTLATNLYKRFNKKSTQPN